MDALDICRFAPRSTLLDVGCGLGHTVEHLSRCGHHAVGIDNDHVLVRQVREQKPYLRVSVASADRLPYPAASFDGAFMECVLSLCPNTRLALEEVRRVVHSDGLLVLSDVYDRVASPYGQRPRAFQPGLMDRGSFTRSLASVGFCIEHWEDRSKVLAEYVAHMVLNAGRPPALPCEPASIWTKRGNEGARRSRVGYFLAVARAGQCRCPPRACLGEATDEPR